MNLLLDTNVVSELRKVRSGKADVKPESQDALVESDTQVSANAVALFKALGGGWEINEAQVQASAR